MPLSARESRTATARSRKPALAARLAGDRARFAVFCLLVACVFAMGGSARADISSLVLLRPLAFLAAGYALLVARPGELRAAALPLVLVGCLAAIIALQLVPLPAAWWPSLPGRELYVRIAQDAGLQLASRPLTLSPSRTLNALFSLSVPLAAVLLVAVQGVDARSRILTVIAAACGISALVAVVQTASSGSSALFLYRVTNEGVPVGLMANRNHQAVLMVILLVLLAYHCRRVGLSAKSRPLLVIGTMISALVVLALVLVAGSRAGLLLLALTVPVAAWMLSRGTAADAARRIDRVWIAAAAGLLATLVAATIALSRATSVTRLWTDDAMNDYRVERLPAVLDMLREHWLLGTGFGSFEGAFKRYEPIELLTPFIFNHAHNDWLQFPLEGGLLASLLLLFVLVRIAIGAPDIVRAAHRGQVGTRVTALIVLVLIALASVVDYPLRTPIFMLVAAVSFMLVTRPVALEKAA